MEQLNGLSSQLGLPSYGRQYLTFTLGQEQYGVEILNVQEIRGYAAITPIPSTPPDIRGVMTLRGAVVSVVDLRTRLGLANADCTPFTVIVVVRVGSQTIGLVVDAVSDVLTVAPADIQPAPAFGATVDTGFISGMATIGRHLLVLLDLEHLLGSEMAASPSSAAP